MEDKKLTFEEIMPLVIEMCDGEDGEGVYGFCDEGVYYDVPADFEPLPEGSEYDYDLGRQRDTILSAWLAMVVKVREKIIGLYGISISTMYILKYKAIINLITEPNLKMGGIVALRLFLKK